MTAVIVDYMFKMCF